jgi:hypothetical protein
VVKNIGETYPKLNENPFFGGPIHEEDSPGNFILRQTTNGVDFVWFDANGGEQTSHY